MHTRVDRLTNTPFPPTSPPLQRKQQETERTREAACSYRGRIRFQKGEKARKLSDPVFPADSGVTQDKVLNLRAAESAFYKGDNNDCSFLGPWWDGMKWHGFKHQPWTWRVVEWETQRPPAMKRLGLCAPVAFYLAPCWHHHAWLWHCMASHPATSHHALWLLGR